MEHNQDNSLGAIPGSREPSPSGLGPPGFDPGRVEGLDAGIAGAVSILRQHGIETFESCEGGEGHAFPEPTVRFHGRHSGFKAFSVAMEYGLPVLALRLSYSEHDHALEGPHWEIVFREKVPER